MSASTHARLLRGSGVLLFLLGVVHLVATPHIASLIRHSTSPKVAEQLTPPMLLNHVLVGLLLLPLGYLTFYAASHSAARVRWAQVIVRTTAVTVATLPVTLLVLMGKRYYFDAPLFVVGVALVVGAAVTLLVAAFSTPRDRVGSPMLAHQTSNQAMQRTAPRSDV
jgi:ammonia channel protein AmtB